MNTTLTALCQVRLLRKIDKGQRLQYPEDLFAVASSCNDIHLYCFAYSLVLFSFSAHDDYITNLVFAGDRLVSQSLDMTLKVWNFGIPLTQVNEVLEKVDVLYDHEH